ncbi:MAG: oligosaccharide flippase family protein [Bacteroidales bacterium]
MAKFTRDIIKVSGSNTSAAIVNIIIGIILTRLLGPEGRGIYAAIIVVPMIVLSFAELGIRRSSIYHIGKKEFSDQDLISSLMFTMLLSTGLGAVICIFFFSFVNNPEFTIPLIIMAVMRIPVRLVRQYASGVFMGKEQFGLSIIVQWLYIFSYLFFIILFLWVMRLDVLGALMAMVVSNVVASGYAIYKVSREIKISMKFNSNVLKSLVKFGLIYSAALFVMTLNIKVDILILGSLSTMEQVGFYSLATAIVSNWQVPFSIGGLIISKSANSTDHNLMNFKIARLIRISFVVSLGMYSVLYFIVPYLISILYGSEFMASVQMVRILIPGILMLIIVRLMGNRLAGEGRPYIFMVISIPALIINIGLNYLWIPQFEGVGAAMATVVSYSFLAIFGLIIYSRVVKMPVREIFRFQRGDMDFLVNMIQKRINKRKRKKNSAPD